jgi:hypothetical protein
MTGETDDQESPNSFAATKEREGHEPVGFPSHFAFNCTMLTFFPETQASPTWGNIKKFLAMFTQQISLGYTFPGSL